MYPQQPGAPQQQYGAPQAQGAPPTQVNAPAPSPAVQLAQKAPMLKLAGYGAIVLGSLFHFIYVVVEKSFNLQEVSSLFITIGLLVLSLAVLLVALNDREVPASVRTALVIVMFLILALSLGATTKGCGKPL